LIKNYERDRFNISEQDAGGKPYTLFLIPLGYSGFDRIAAEPALVLTRFLDANRYPLRLETL
jgi:hypothetical protein